MTAAPTEADRLLARASRERQGLSPTLDSPEAIDRVVTLLASTGFGSPSEGAKP